MKAVNTIEEYMESVPEPARTTLNKVRAMIRAAAPKETTESISYGMPMFKHKGMVMGLAAFKNHCSIFPGASILQFKVELQNYTTTKGSVHFPLDKPLPAALVKKLVKTRVAMNEAAESKRIAKKKSKKKRS